MIPAILKTGRVEAKRIVYEFQDKRKIVERPILVRQRTLKTPPGTGPMLAAHIRYLEGRGFDPDVLADEWGAVGTNHLGGEWSWRVVLPVSNGDGRIVAYQGRTIGDVKPRYKLTDDADCLEDPDTMLFGIDKIHGDTVAIVEGALKVVRMGVGAIGTLGIDWKRPQLNRLRRFKRRFVLFDPGIKSQQRAEQLALSLSLFPGITEVLSGFDVAPDEFTEQQVKEVRREIGLHPI